MSGNVSNAFSFLVDVVISVYAGIILLRILLQLVRANFYNPLSQFIVKVTAPLLNPLRRVVPGWRGLDVAAVLLVLVVVLLDVLALLFIRQRDVPPIPYLLLWTVAKTAAITIRLYVLTILLEVLASWFNPGPYRNPVIGVIAEVNRPVLDPVRRLMPTREIGIDFSPLIVLLLAYFFLYLLPLPYYLR